MDLISCVPNRPPFPVLWVYRGKPPVLLRQPGSTPLAFAGRVASERGGFHFPIQSDQSNEKRSHLSSCLQLVSSLMSIQYKDYKNSRLFLFGGERGGLAQRRKLCVCACASVVLTDFGSANGGQMTTSAAIKTMFKRLLNKDRV